MDQVVMSRAAELLVAASGFAGLLTPKIDLFTNDFLPLETSVLADFTLATYTGYVQGTGTLSAVYVSQPDNLVSVDALPVHFVGPTAGAGVDAFGWVMYDGTGPGIYAAGRFDTPPKGLVNLLDKVSVAIELHLAGSGESETNT